MISVFMPVYNGEAYLEQALKSILNQSFQDFEFLIIDDGSTDRSAEIVKSFESNKIRFLQNPQNQGLAFTRNRGIAQAKEKYLAILDCDDWAYPLRLEKQFDFLEKNPRVAAVGSWIETIDKNNQVLGTWKLASESNEIKVKLLFQNCFAQSAMMIRRELLDKMTYRQEFVSAEDYDLWVRLSKNYLLANLPEVLLKYRVHDQSISQVKSEKLHQSVLEIIREQLTILEITASQQDIDLHLGIGHLEKNLDFLAVYNWLLRLYQQNQKLNIYPKEDFDNLLAIYWKEFFISQKPNFGKVQKWLASPLSKKKPTFGRILLKSLLKSIGF